MVCPVLLFEDFYHRLKVADVNGLAEDAVRVMVCNHFSDAWQERLVHWTVGVELGPASREWAVKRSTHDDQLTKCLAQP